MAAKIPHLAAVRRFASTGLKNPRCIRRSSLVKDESVRQDRIVHSLASYLTGYRRTFMNNSGDLSKSDDSKMSPDEILNQCSGIYDSLSGLNDKLGGMAIPKSSPHTRWVWAKVPLLYWLLCCNFCGD